MAKLKEIRPWPFHDEGQCPLGQMAYLCSDKYFFLKQHNTEQLKWCIFFASQLVFPKLTDPGFECSLTLLHELLRHQSLKAGTAVISVKNENQSVVRVACRFFNDAFKITTRVEKNELTNLFRFWHSFCAVFRLSSVVLKFQQLFYKLISHDKAYSHLCFAGLKTVSEHELDV